MNAYRSYQNTYKCLLERIQLTFNYTLKTILLHFMLVSYNLNKNYVYGFARIAVKENC